MLLLALSACTQLPDTVGQAAPANTVWQLAEIDGDPVTFAATLRLEADGKVSGDGPCNRFSAKQTAPLPWVEITDVVATRRACPDLEGEGRYLTALSEMDFAEVATDNLLMSNSEGRELYFRAR